MCTMLQGDAKTTRTTAPTRGRPEAAAASTVVELVIAGTPIV